jgi:hypothetical protein
LTAAVALPADARDERVPIERRYSSLPWVSSRLVDDQRSRDSGA